MDSLILSIVTAALSLLVGVLSNLFNQSDLFFYLQKALGIPEEKRDAETFGERLRELTANLTEASSAVDQILNELESVSRERETAIKKLESRLSTLSEKENELQTKIRHLENTPLPVAEYFASLTDKGEKRSARRDYLLFGAGVLVSTVIAIILGLLGF